MSFNEENTGLLIVIIATTKGLCARKGARINLDKQGFLYHVECFLLKVFSGTGSGRRFDSGVRARHKSLCFLAGGGVIVLVW